MAKKKIFLNKFFGKKFNGWDLTLLLLMGGALVFIMMYESTIDIGLRIAWTIFALTFGSLLFKFLKKLMRRAKK